MSSPLLTPIVRAPGFSRLSIYSILNYGQAIRDQYVWEFPILPGAVYTYQQMASGRELKVSGFAKGVTRTIEWLQAAETKSYDGITYTGFEDFLRRRVLDYLCVGRTVLAAPEDGPLEYLDPTRLTFNMQSRKWHDMLYGRFFDEKDVIVNHPIPVGSTGAFMAPLAFIMPTAMLAWLIREHDKASADGRKLRDVLVVQGADLAEQIKSSIEQMIAIYSGADVTKLGIPVVFTEGVGDGNSKLATEDLFARIGISEIPQGFDRAGFQFEYVNEIAAALGISLRHFWNSEKATNRALEEVQEARQAQKGPSSFVRNEQRLLNQGQLLKRFGSNIRMAFIEEVDVQSRKANAEVLKLYAESAGMINALAPGMINLEALFGWLQGDDILPSDIEILNTNWKQVMVNPDSLETPGDGEGGEKVVQRNTLAQPSVASLEKALPDPDDELGYGEVSMNLDGKILERRNKIISVEKLIVRDLKKDVSYMESLVESETPIDFQETLKASYTANLAKFFTLEKSLIVDIAENSSMSPDDVIHLQNLSRDSEITDDDHRKIGHIILKLMNINDVE